MKMDKLEKIEIILAILEKNLVTIPIIRPRYCAGKCYGRVELCHGGRGRR